MKALFALLVPAALIAFIILYSAVGTMVVVYWYWRWFLLDVFPALPVISWLQALAVGMFIGLFKGSSYYKSEEDKYQWDNFFVSPWVTLFVGWFIHLIFF